MANGLLGVASFLRGAEDEYDKYQDRQLKSAALENDKKALAARLAAEGFETNPDGQFVRTADSKKERAYERATKEAGVRKAGFGLGEYDPVKDSYAINKVPGFKDVEEENKVLQNKRLKRDLEDGKKPSAGEFAASGYAKRLEDAEGVFSDLNKQGYDPSSISSSIQKAGFFPDALQGENVKREEQAKRNFVNALLRRESGAAISQSEFDNANKQYFPQPNDPPSLLKQKEVNRRLAFEGIRAEGARAYDRSPGVQEVKGLLGPAVAKKASGGGGFLNSAVASAPSAEDAQAIAWAKSNPRDPRAAQILKMHGM